MHINDLMRDVRDFHVAFGHPTPNKPTMLTPERVAARAKWKREEIQEFEDAQTLVDQADACIDEIYFCVGSLVEMGIDPQPLWAIVQAANMAKLGPDGKPIYKADGKTAKPEGWQAPEPLLHAEIERQITAAAE
jgi:predicted HAD superfamily Cof-like phosphohydrolase